MKLKLIIIFTIFFQIISSFLLISYAQNFKSRVDPILNALYNEKVTKTLPKKSGKISNEINVANSFIPSVAQYFNININEPDPTVRVLIKYHGEVDDLLQNGIIVQSTIGNIFTAHFPISKLRSLEELDGVESIVLGKPIKPDLDVSAPKVNAEVARTVFDYDGENIIIGVLDTGIDINHDDFKNNDGTTRILYIWDQTITTAGQTPTDWSYGTEWNSTHINSGSCTQTDNIGHGSHIAGIAAGNGRATGNGQPAGTYVGIAPKADLIVVNIDTDNFANLIDGLLWIGSKAEALNKPWVANLSVGTEYGPRDGTSLFEEAIFGVTNLTDIGKGRIIVKSAGNSGHDLNDPNREDRDRIHATGSDYSEATFVVNSGDGGGQQNEYFWIQVWYPQSTNYSVTITAPSGHTYGPYTKGWGTGTPGQGVYYTTDTDGLVSIHNEHWGEDSNHDRFYPNTQDNFIEILITDLDIDRDGNSDYDLRNGSWTLTMSSGSGRWDAYIPTSSAVLEGVYFSESTYENARIISEPGNAYNVITVGSFNSKNSWIDINGNNQSRDGYPIDMISYSSSPGPTRDGRAKPDIFAPGAWIASSMSSDASGGIQSTQKSQDGKHFNYSGTSFSVPHVTGAVALLLEQNSDYTYTDIIDILNQSKTPDGYLDIYEAILVNEGATGIEDVIEISNGPTVINPNSAINYQAEFHDYPPPGDYIPGNWYWSIELQYDEEYYIYASGTTTGNYWTLWDVNLGPIPSGYNWVRDEAGRISGKVKVHATDNGGFGHSHEKRIAVNSPPDIPLIYSKTVGNERVILSFLAGGSTGYKVFYDTNSGHPYNGVGATEGNSPVDVGISRTVTLSGLTAGTKYYLAVKAYNSHGESGYSSEVELTPIPYNITSDFTLMGNVQIFDETIVANSKILTINPGTIISFHPDTKINVEAGSKIIANGSAAQPIIFNRYNPSDDWDRIILNGSNNEFSWCQFEGGYGIQVYGALDINQSTVENATYGIKFENGSTGSVSNSTFSDNYYGIYLNSAEPTVQNCLIEDNKYGLRIFNSYSSPDWNTIHISNNTISDNTYYGLYLYNSSPTLSGNVISSNGRSVLWSGSNPILDDNDFKNSTYYGLACFGNCSPSMYLNGSLGGHNTIIYNGAQGIRITGSSDPILGRLNPSMGGYNSIYSNSGYEIDNITSNSIMAMHNWWGSAAGPGSDYTGSVDWLPPLSYDPNDPLKILAGDFSVDPNSDLPVNLQMAYYEQSKQNYAAAAEGFRNHFVNMKGSRFNARSVVQFIKSLSYYQSPGEIVNVIDKALQNDLDVATRFELLSAKANQCVLAQNPGEALNALNKALKDKLTNENVNRIYLQNAMIYAYSLNDKSGAEEYFNMLIGNSEKNSDYYLVAEEELTNLNKTFSKSSGEYAQTEPVLEPDKYSLLQNYPNPFNPETKIRFNLPEDSQVKLEVYNLQGQKVITLVDKMLPAGIHTANFSGSNFSSGIYFYRLETEKFNQVKRMLLIR